MFTDLSPVDLSRLVREAGQLVLAFRAEESTPVPLPLLPDEYDRIRTPPPAHRPYASERDYQDTVREEPDFVRPADVIARDITLMRLGRDPDSRPDRAALRMQLRRARG
jgi:hypothetical protein